MRVNFSAMLNGCLHAAGTGSQEGYKVILTSSQCFWPDGLQPKTLFTSCYAVRLVSTFVRGQFHFGVHHIFNNPKECTFADTFAMVVGAFPLFKLASLAVKQISKPIANSLKTTAKQSDFFRKYVCIWPGQGEGYCDGTDVDPRLLSLKVLAQLKLSSSLGSFTPFSFLWFPSSIQFKNLVPELSKWSLKQNLRVQASRQFLAESQ